MPPPVLLELPERPPSLARPRPAPAGGLRDGAGLPGAVPAPGRSRSDLSTMIAPADFAALPAAAPATDPAFRPSRPERRPRERTERAREEAVHDAALVARFNAGDESAFVEIMARHRERVFAVAYSLLKNRADAQEIAQDTFVRAHGGLARFRGDSSLATWIHRITLNLSRNRYWYFFRRRRHATFSLDCMVGSGQGIPISDLLAETAAGPVQDAGTREFSELVAACIARLGKDQREILLLRSSLHRSYSEIARHLGLRLGTVKSRIARARESLRLLLVEACPEFGPDAQPMAWLEPNRRPGGLTVIQA